MVDALYHPDCEEIFAVKRFINIALAVLCVAAGIIGYVIAQSIIIIPFSIVCALYFLFLIWEQYSNKKNKKYTCIRAIAVSSEESQNIIKQTITTYRLIPVDENGEFISRNGTYDFFLEVNTSKKGNPAAMFVGAIYDLVFLSNTDNVTEFNSSNLYGKQRKKVQATAEEDKASADNQHEKLDNLVYLGIPKRGDGEK